ncbi:hypothetical protein AVEN_179261-1 [Araneus ventricosus]|uniref:Uncharacterized protein n=1 Tax=Araneus ventricosus TaxID=182803 RepID=A0A4Y2TWV8_ARAVE|nr:hypothetical protein AVEN_179261-1 [Araneus ventricosus]
MPSVKFPDPLLYEFAFRGVNYNPISSAAFSAMCYRWLFVKQDLKFITVRTSKLAEVASFQKKRVRYGRFILPDSPLKECFQLPERLFVPKPRLIKRSQLKIRTFVCKIMAICFIYLTHQKNLQGKAKEQARHCPGML